MKVLKLVVQTFLVFNIILDLVFIILLPFLQIITADKLI